MVNKTLAPTIHDMRAIASTNEGGDYYGDREYLEYIVSTINPHNNPKEQVEKLFPSARVVVKQDSSLHVSAGSLWQCNEKGCDFNLPIITLQVYFSEQDMRLGVVKKISCEPVLTCPECLNQDVEIYEE